MMNALVCVRTRTHTHTDVSVTQQVEEQLQTELGGAGGLSPDSADVIQLLFASMSDGSEKRTEERLIEYI